jgi:hypothetical protein
VVRKGRDELGRGGRPNRLTLDRAPDPNMSGDSRWRREAMEDGMGEGAPSLLLDSTHGRGQPGPGPAQGGVCHYLMARDVHGVGVYCTLLRFSGAGVRPFVRVQPPKERGLHLPQQHQPRLGAGLHRRQLLCYSEAQRPGTIGDAGAGRPRASTSAPGVIPFLPRCINRLAR